MLPNIYSKTEFKEIMDNLAEDARTSDRIDKIIRESETPAARFTKEFFDPAVLFTSNTSALISALERMFLDDSLVISWWVYEQEFGERCNGEDVIVASSDGAERTYDLRTVELLYDYLVENLENEFSKRIGNT